PGVYVRWYNAGGYARYSRPLGVGAAVIKSNWGPVGKLFTVESGDAVKEMVGTGDGADVVKEIFEGGAYFVQTVRIGTGGTPATLSLVAETLKSVELQTLYPTSRSFSVTVREALDPTNKELILF